MAPPPTSKKRNSRQKPGRHEKANLANRPLFEGPDVLEGQKSTGQTQMRDGTAKTLQLEAEEPGDPPALDRLRALPGLGPARLEQAVEALGSPQAVLQVLEAGDPEPLARLGTIGPRLARRLVLHAHGNDPDRFLATPRAARLFEETHNRLVALACTTGGRNRLRLLAPHPERDERTRRIQWCMQSANEAETIDLERARDLLRRLGPLPDPRPAFEADVLLLFDDAADLEAARAAGLDRWAETAHVGQQGILEQVQERHVALHVSRNPSGRPHTLEQADQLVTIRFTLEPALVVPWGTIERYRKAKDTLEAAAGLSLMRGLNDPPSRRVLDWLEDGPGDERTLSASELESKAQVILEQEMQRAEEDLERLTLTGNELVRALKEELPGRVLKVYEQAADRARRRLEEETGLAVDAYTEDRPPRVDPRAIAATLRTAQQKTARDRFDHQLRLAQELHGIEQEILAELADHEAFDARQAMGSFWNDQGLIAPEWGKGLLVEGLQPIQLKGDPQGVDYRLGLKADASEDEHRVALLTGANSGGKSTLLDSIALTLGLAHAGMGVPASRAIVPEVDAVHLYAPTRDRGAGALEALLLELFPLLGNPGRRFLLADELEAITELEAAGQIIAQLVEGLVEQDDLAVLATHLAPHLIPALHPDARSQVRIDGIEAQGLDAHGALIVDRSPRLDHLARSTPELILRRLAEHGPPELADRFRALAERVHKHMG